MKHLILFIAFVGIFGKTFSQDKYLSYLHDNYCSPTQYLENIFENKDLVVLCERMHPEMTQYDFIQEIITQEWFIDRVGNLIIEVSTRSIQNDLDDLLLSEKLEEEELQKRLIHICRNNSIHTLWTCSNFYRLVKYIYTLNQSLSANKKVRLIGADIEFSWNNINNRKDLRKFKKSKEFLDRDLYMGNFVVDWYKSHKNHKALIIMNTRHSYKFKHSTASVIMKVLPDQTTNILLNETTVDMKLIHGGKWDKAFKENNNKPIAFAFKGSPFGQDIFDHYPWTNWEALNIHYSDIFDHMIFYNPLEKMYVSNGVDGLVAPDFEQELARRHKYRWFRKPKTYFQKKLRKSKYQSIKVSYYKLNQ
jgi:hypothetical protein